MSKKTYDVAAALNDLSKDGVLEMSGESCDDPPEELVLQMLTRLFNSSDEKGRAHLNDAIVSAAARGNPLALRLREAWKSTSRLH
jgi:hypothetical protein